MLHPTRDPEVLLRHAGFVRGLARELVFDAELARDVEQETWLRALQHAPRDLRSPRAWLAAVVRSIAQRSARRSAALRDVERRAERDARHDGRHEGFPSPDELLEQEQARRALVEAVLALEEPLRGTLVLHYLDGLELREVARRTDVPVETARSRVKRGLARLREELRHSHSSDAWTLALVRVFELDPPRLARGFELFSRGLSPLATTMTTTHKLASIVAALTLGLLSGWWWIERDPSSARTPASASAGELAGGASHPTEMPARVAKPQVREPLVDTPRGGAIGRTSELGTLRVHVVWASDGTSATQLEVCADGQDLPSTMARRRAHTDEHGEVEFSALPAGLWFVHASLSDITFAQIRAGETAQIELAIPRGIAVRGSVVDASGTPVSGADIYLSAGVNAAPYDVSLVARSDVHGRFELRSAPSRVGACLSARAKDRAPTPQFVLTGAPRSVAEVQLVFEVEGVRLGGRVLGPSGEPLEGAQVLVGSEREIAYRTQADGTVSQAPIGELVTTDSSGAFALDGVARAEVTVQVRARDCAPWSSRCDARVLRHLDVRLERSARLHGVVRDASGRALSNARISTEGTSFFARASTRSSADGSYALEDLGAGSLRVRVESARTDVSILPTSSEALTRSFELVAGADVVWDPELGGGAELRGRVELAGAALDGWLVRGSRPVTALEPRSEDAWRPFAEARTDADGRFVLHDCPPAVDVTLFGRSTSPFPLARVEAVRPGEAEIVLRPDPALLPSASIHGRLVDAQRHPVGNADVVARCPTVGTTLTHPDPDSGRFEFQALPPGQWTLEVDAHVAGWAARILEPRALRSEDRWDVGELTLGAGGALVVALHRAPGVDGGAAQVVVLGEDGRPVQWIEVREDLARSRPLPPGRYRVVLAGLQVSARTVTVVGGDETRIEMWLAPAEEVTARIRGVGGLPPGGRAEVRLRGSDGEIVWWGESASSAGDAHELRWQLSPGSYRAEIAAPDARDAAVEFSVPQASGAPVTVDLALPSR